MLHKLIAQIRWLWYFHVTRKAQRFIPWVARKLPNKVKYYVVIHGMVAVEPQSNPTGVTGMQMLDLWDKKEPLDKLRDRLNARPL